MASRNLRNSRARWRRCTGQSPGRSWRPARRRGTWCRGARNHGCAAPLGPGAEAKVVWCGPGLGSGKTVYLLDEPTTGLSFQLCRPAGGAAPVGGRRQYGNPHRAQPGRHQELRLGHRSGPRRGDSGGKLIATGTPEKLAMMSRSLTGRYIKDVLKACAPAAAGRNTSDPEPMGLHVVLNKS